MSTRLGLGSVFVVQCLGFSVLRSFMDDAVTRAQQ